MSSMYTETSSSTFVDNKKLPIHRWYKYFAGFSASWVEYVVKQHISKTEQTDIMVLDPFAGSGTTLLACDTIGVKS